MKLTVKKGTTSKRVGIFIQDSSSTTGAGLTALAFDTAGLTCYYWREDEGNANATAVTLATMTRGTWTSGGFIAKDGTNMPGAYEFGIPDAALATGAGWVIVMLKGAANMVPVVLEIELVDNTVADVYTRIGAPAGASIAADIDAVPTAAEINAEVLDVLNVDTFAQPGQGTPPATTSIRAMLAYLYKAWRNRVTQTATQYSLYNDDATTVDHKATVSDDGTTFSKGEVATGP